MWSYRTGATCDRLLGERDTLAADVGDGAAEVGGVPQHDGVDDQVQPGGAVGHVLGGAVAQLAQAVKEHGAREGVPALALVEVAVQRLLSSGSSSQSQVKIARSSRPISRSARCSAFCRGKAAIL